MTLRTPLMAIISLIVSGAMLVAGLAPAAAQDDQDEQLKVLVTFSILADIVENVGGDHVEILTMVGANADAHTFEPSPRDVAKLSDVAIIFENGLEFEQWLDSIYRSSDSTAARIVVSETIVPRTIDDDHDDGHEEADEHEDDEDHDTDGDHADGDEHDDEDGLGHGHGELDPHVWQNVANVIAQVEVIRDALIAADPANEAAYQANATAYIGQLEELDAWIQTEVEQIPESQRKLVTSHDTFGYFADRYGFEVIGTALGSLSTEVGDPSAAEIAGLIRDIEAAGVPTIFAENVHNPDLMESIASEAGVTLSQELYTDALGPEGSGAETYIGMMRHNVTVIVTELSA